MGTAPDDRQDSLLPNPGEVVAATVATLLGQGLSERDALTQAASVAVRAREYATLAGLVHTPWLDEIAELTRHRLEALPPSYDDTTGVDHADGTSSRAGRPG